MKDRSRSHSCCRISAMDDLIDISQKSLGTIKALFVLKVDIINKKKV
jgi:hypothetical protein